MRPLAGATVALRVRQVANNTAGSLPEEVDDLPIYVIQHFSMGAKNPDISSEIADRATTTCWFPP